MRWYGFFSFNAIFITLSTSALGGTVIEGKVALPKSSSAPVLIKRYEIVTHGGALSTEPPLAVIYLEGSFGKPASLPTKQVGQKNLAFVPSLLPVQVSTKIEFPNFDD